MNAKDDGPRVHAVRGSSRAIALLSAANALGFAMAWIDSRPTWDDTGITVGAVLLVSAVFGWLEPVRPWRWAFALGVWFPILALASGGNLGSSFALLVSAIGAYGASALRKAASR